MDKDIGFGIGVTTLICSVGYVIGGLPALLASLAFSSIPWVYEIRNRIRNPSIILETCVLCGRKFRITNTMTSGERKICHLCINKIFKYEKSVPEMDTSASE